MLRRNRRCRGLSAFSSLWWSRCSRPRVGVCDATAKSLCHTNMIPTVSSTANIVQSPRRQHICIHLVGCVYQVRSSILTLVLQASAATHAAAESPSLFCSYFHFKVHLPKLATAKSPIADVVVSSLVFQCFCRLVVFSRFVFQAASAEAPTRRDGEDFHLYSHGVLLTSPIGSPPQSLSHFAW